MADDAATRNAIQDLRDAIRRQEQTLAGFIAQLAQTNQAQTQALQNLAAKTQRAGAALTNLAVGITVVQITWPQLWPDTFYGAYATIISGNAVIGTLFAQLTANSKAVDSCTVTVVNTGLNVVASAALDVLGVHG